MFVFISTFRQHKLDGPYDNFDNAFEDFSKKFLEKTGNEWKSKDEFVCQKDKYDLLNVDYTASSSGIWEYYVDDNVAGKSNGWHEYSKEGKNINCNFKVQQKTYLQFYTVMVYLIALFNILLSFIFLFNYDFMINFKKMHCWLGNEDTEKLWITYQSNKSYNKRIVESGEYSYHVDLVSMTQVIRLEKIFLVYLLSAHPFINILDKHED